ncbi:MAG: DNA-3-methyladenine glycosylase I [Nevskiales bacterium]
MSFPKFESIHERAAANHGGEAKLQAKLPKPRSATQLQKLGDDRYLAEITRRVFCAGFVWKIIEHKWANFEHSFVGFDPGIIAAWPDEHLESLMKDEGIVRNYIRIRSVRENAWFVLDIADEYGSFGDYIASWPEHNIVGLWADLKKRGSRLGGMSAGYFLRFVGKDTFLLTPDVTACLVNHAVLDKHNPTAKRDLQQAQDCFNAWHDETGLPLCQLSRIASCSVG